MGSQASQLIDDFETRTEIAFTGLAAFSDGMLQGIATRRAAKAGDTEAREAARNRFKERMGEALDSVVSGLKFEEETAAKAGEDSQVDPLFSLMKALIDPPGCQFVRPRTEVEELPDPPVPQIDDLPPPRFNAAQSG